MRGFLQSVAEGYVSRYNDLSRLTFIMPSRRSGSFLLRELSTYCGRPVIAPKILTVTDFVAEVSDLIPDHRLPSLFLLFECYKKISNIGDMDFDRFSSWGETVLSDFNEIDMHLVDPDDIFKNVSDLNSIRSNFLTEEQRQAMNRYFGYSYRELEESENTFWTNFADYDDTTSGIKRKYFNLWQVLNPLYHDFKERLEMQGLTTSGGAFRKAAEKIAADHIPFPGEKLIFVGFNALTESERLIFKLLKKMEVDMGFGKEPKADFIWDPVSEFLAENDDPAVRFVSYNMDTDRFPSPKWMEPYLQKSRPSLPPEVEIISVPSNVMQVKLICGKLKEEVKSLAKEVDNARVAIVLPDENLLLPLLYSLPEEYSNPNLTMGYPLRHTPVVSFVGLLRRLQARVRDVKGTPEFFFEDVRDLLGHPYSQVIFGRKNITAFIKRQTDEKRITVPENLMECLGESAGKVFLPVKKAHAPDVVKYMSEILNIVRSRLSENSQSYLRREVETGFIDTFQRALVLLEGCISLYDTSMSCAAVFRLAERQIAAETVPFEGEPLKGLQVMGLLETRALDFDYVLMPSMNDKTMPRRGRSSSFISNALRVAYGMPPANYQEELFAYYFYRLAGRCREMTLTYDARSNNNRGGGVSRYVLQMLYLADKVNVKKKEAGFNLPEFPKEERCIPKSEAIMDKIKRYYVDYPLAKGEKQKNISASALGNYGKCPLKFLFNNVMEIQVDPEPVESIDAINLGSIVHEVMERLYMRGAQSGVLLAHPLLVDNNTLDSLLAMRTPSGEPLILAEAKRAINKFHFKLQEDDWTTGEMRGSATIVINHIVDMVKSIIRYDKTKTPFFIHGCEIKETYRYELPDGSKINFKMVIDRLDEVEGQLRIVDYKTGSVHLQAKKLDEVFDGTYGASNILQLVVYSMILDRMVKDGKLTIAGRKGQDLGGDIEMVIYNIPAIRKNYGIKKGSGENTEGYPAVGGKKVRILKDFLEIQELSGLDFKGGLDAMLVSIFNPTVPFSAVPSPTRCRFCDFKLRCENSGNARMVAEE